MENTEAKNDEFVLPEATRIELGNILIEQAQRKARLQKVTDHMTAILTWVSITAVGIIGAAIACFGVWGITFAMDNVFKLWGLK